jgi:murein DD-endopeptidase MepM/ murein hydrolase activator NlpD
MRPTLCSPLRSLSTAGYFTVLLCSAQAQSGVVRETALSTVDTPTHVAPGMQLPSGKVVRVDLGHPQCLTDEVFALIDAEADANVAALGLERPELLDHSRGGTPLFNWPTRPKAGFDDYGYYTVNFLYDHATAPGTLQDYNCGTRTYDWSSGNHRGTDIILWPYAWRNMQEELMEVVAAAAGTIVIRRDGYSDVNCAIDGNGNWNGFVIQHEDGSRAWYMHFTNGGISDKEVGETVEAGEWLGIAGSSGSSNWPHLHFEVRLGNGSYIDPWDGPCNSTNPGESWWAEQQPNKVPWINHISTHNSIRHDNDCPNVEETYEQESFDIGDSLILKLHYRDLDLNAVTSLSVIGPSGQPFLAWDFTSPWAFGATTYAYWQYVIDNAWAPGTYIFKAVLDGRTYERVFYVGTAAGIADPQQQTFSLQPNPARTNVVLDGLSTPFPEDHLVLREASGRLVRTQRITATREVLDLAGLAPGIFLVEVWNGGSRSVGRLVLEQ